MSNLLRLSMTIERPLYERLEKLRVDSGYSNRSEFVRDLVRDRLVEQEWEQDQQVVGTITMVYDHHQRLLTKKLTHEQHMHHDLVHSTTHVHLDHDTCLEVIIVSGTAGQVQDLHDRLRRQKGVYHATVSLSSTGKQLR